MGCFSLTIHLETNMLSSQNSVPPFKTSFNYDTNQSLCMTRKEHYNELGMWSKSQLGSVDCAIDPRSSHHLASRKIDPTMLPQKNFSSLPLELYKHHYYQQVIHSEKRGSHSIWGKIIGKRIIFSLPQFPKFNFFMRSAAKSRSIPAKSPASWPSNRI